MDASEKQGPPELRFTVLGPSGAGKTTLLACMYNEFDELKSGMLVPDAKTSRILQGAYRSLRDTANSESPVFSTAISSTEDLREYKFTIKGRNTSIPIHFYDFPGSWMDPNHESYYRVIEAVKSSIAVLIAVNTPYMMEEDGRYKDEGLDSWTIQNVLTQSYDERGKLVLLVPIKCEKYTAAEEDTARMRAKMKDRGIFSKTLGLIHNPVYRDLAMAIIPVHTVGNADFTAFKKQRDGTLCGEVYRKRKESFFCPKNTDQPLRFVMSYLLNEYMRAMAALDEMPSEVQGGKGLFGRMFQKIAGIFGSGRNSGTISSEFIELSDFIRQGMRLDDPEFEILSRRDKLEKIPLEELNAAIIREKAETVNYIPPSGDDPGKRAVLRITKKHGFVSTKIDTSSFGIPAEAEHYSHHLWWCFPFRLPSMFFCSNGIYWLNDRGSKTEYLSYGQLRHDPSISLEWLQREFKDFPESSNVVLTLMELKSCQEERQWTTK